MNTFNYCVLTPAYPCVTLLSNQFRDVTLLSNKFHDVMLLSNPFGEVVYQVRQAALRARPLVASSVDTISLKKILWFNYEILSRSRIAG